MTTLDRLVIPINVAVVALVLVLSPANGAEPTVAGSFATATWFSVPLVPYVLLAKSRVKYVVVMFYAAAEFYAVSSTLSSGGDIGLALGFWPVYLGVGLAVVGGAFSTRSRRSMDE